MQAFQRVKPINSGTIPLPAGVMPLPAATMAIGRKPKALWQLTPDQVVPRGRTSPLPTPFFRVQIGIFFTLIFFRFNVHRWKILWPSPCGSVDVAVT